MSQLAEIIDALNALPEKDRQAVERAAIEATKSMVWCPNPGPQTDAFHCEADELFYGGQAGGGKSDLGIGLALTTHTRSLILRRIKGDTKKLIPRAFEIAGHKDGFNGQDSVWKMPSGKQIDFGGCEQEDDKQRYKGDPHDLIVFDEGTDFLESQYRFIIGWNRSANPKQRCRVLVTSNPPTTAEGLWVLQYWGPWLDPKHPNPAKPGELRWFTTVNDKDTEVDGRGPHMIDGEWIEARSRTYIPAKLSDNPDLAATNYASVLAAMPAELRAAYRDGRFDAGLEDDPWQAIPTDWVLRAQERWKKTPPVGVPMCAIGVDVAQGGTDNTVLAMRHDGWFAPLVSIPGAQTPGGTDVAGQVIAKRRDNAKVIIDIGGGWGGDAYAHLRANKVDAESFMGVKQSRRRTVDNQLTFFNVRTEAYWRFREALNPDQEGGSPIMLPDDRELLADLTAPTYSVERGGIKLEAKEKLVERLGRSPDKGDAVVMAWFSGPKMASHYQEWKNRAAPPRVVMGRASARRTR
jgi:hypothetical protein